MMDVYLIIAALGDCVVVSGMTSSVPFLFCSTVPISSFIWSFENFSRVAVIIQPIVCYF